uniref:Kinase n=1 Tax=Ditylenchus dipsaci TaxID=166011 RepID=A0A915EGZ7_9BILA
MDINEKLPENYEWYRDQIAGHHPSVIRNGVRQIGIIKEKGSDLILKLVQEGDRGKREVDLYERVERCTSENGEEDSGVIQSPFQKKLGFRVLGYRVHSDAYKGTNSRDRLWGRELSEDNIKLAFEEFLVQVRPREALEILNTYIVQLDRIAKWFDSQEQLHFYASSLLFVYEGHLKDKTNSNTK